MKLITALFDGETFVGAVPQGDDRAVHLRRAERAMDGTETMPTTMVEAIAQGEEFLVRAQKVIDWALGHPTREYVYRLNDVRLLAPIPRPAKNIFCIGKNYVDHALELGGADVPEHLIVFTKASTTVIGHEETILRHADVTDEMDYEGELAVVIGKQGRAIRREDALDYVFGYTIINDVTARDLQERHQQYFLGKSLDTFCPMGPWIVPRRFVPNPNDLRIETRVNGEVRQRASTKQLIFSIESIIETISKGITLEPGDIIATGTPAGVGKGMNPPRFLQTGDVIEVTVEGIGMLRNKVGE
ncbi:fumarylacetoacetate hydrolase family protein [Geobacillus sp. PK12]|uniref:fumarylacetoacetate hydrolase family protein n=1 Tax=Geobacillus sp. PK12 TaxID=2508525 RepID=UPI0010132283|nr:fumarylacetoacetate hydrolase family protein [Geobacillus sp. PK12]RXS91840.1 FAA hydrolase family protein [Geobacillus sp. PK12]